MVRDVDQHVFVAKDPAQPLIKLRKWVASSPSTLNDKLLNLLRTPFKPPNEEFDIEFLELFQDIGDDKPITPLLADEYMVMLEHFNPGIYFMPSNFDQDNIGGDIELLSNKPDLKLLLIQMLIEQVKGAAHSYLVCIDFPATTITYIDTGDGLLSLQTGDTDKMQKVKNLAIRIKNAKYTVKTIVDAPKDRDDKDDCVFHTCLFAKCFVQGGDYHELKSPDRKEILYEYI